MVNFITAFLATFVVVVVLAAVVYFIGSLLGAENSLVAAFISASLGVLFFIYPAIFASVAPGPKNDKNTKSRT